MQPLLSQPHQNYVYYVLKKVNPLLKELMSWYLVVDLIGQHEHFYSEQLQDRKKYTFTKKLISLNWVLSL